MIPELVVDFDKSGTQKAMNSGRPFRVHSSGIVQVKTNNGLIVNSTLRKDEWEMLDRAVIKAARYPLKGVADLQSMGLVKPINSLGVLVSQWNTLSAVTPAKVGMVVTETGQRDLTDATLAGVPIPVVWKEFSVESRMLEASRLGGEPLDTTNAIEASRVVSEKLEDMLFNGSTVVMNGNALYGYRTHPSRNTGTASALGGGDFGTIANIVPTFAGAIAALEADRHYGPYVAYVSEAQYNQMANVFYDDGSAQTPLERVLRLGGGLISAVKSIPSDVLAAENAIVAQMTEDVVDWAQTMDTTMVEWVSGNGMTTHFCVMAVAAPRVKSKYDGKSGILHITGA